MKLLVFLLYFVSIAGGFLALILQSPLGLVLLALLGWVMFRKPKG